MPTLTEARRALQELKARVIPHTTDIHRGAGYLDIIGEYLDAQVAPTTEKRIPGQPLTPAEFHTMYGAKDA
jgi:hypothetical protein